MEGALIEMHLLAVYHLKDMSLESVFVFEIYFAGLLGQKACMFIKDAYGMSFWSIDLVRLL